MRPEDFAPTAPGELVLISRPQSRQDLIDPAIRTQERPSHVHAYIPAPLPPDLMYDHSLVSALGRAMLALGQLDGVVRDLPNPSILIRPFLRREAVASSRIEGTVAELADLVMFEAIGQVPEDHRSDVREVDNYVQALEYGLRQSPDRRISVSLIRELHEILMRNVRGGHMQPGEVRAIQNFIGQHGDRIENAKYVPPPPNEVMGLLYDLDSYLATDDEAPPLIRIALAHYQFEAIHPFLDGNGRVGRLLIALLLRKWELMTHPVVDLSAYVLQHRDTYVDGLLRVSQQGDWRAWIDFVLHAVAYQAEDASRRSKRLLDLWKAYEQVLARETKRQKLDAVVDELFAQLTITVNRVSELLDIHFTTAQRTVDRLVNLGILEEATGRKRDRVYRAREIIALLDGLQTLESR